MSNSRSLAALTATVAIVLLAVSCEPQRTALAPTIGKPLADVNESDLREVLLRQRESGLDLLRSDSVPIESTSVAHEADIDLTPHPAVRAWLALVAAQPGHVPMMHTG